MLNILVVGQVGCHSISTRQTPFSFQNFTNLKSTLKETAKLSFVLCIEVHVCFEFGSSVDFSKTLSSKKPLYQLLKYIFHFVYLEFKEFAFGCRALVKVKSILKTNLIKLLLFFKEEKRKIFKMATLLRMDSVNKPC